MGRGWAYLAMDDQPHRADFSTALKLDPSLRPGLEKEVGNIRERKAQEAAGTLNQFAHDGDNPGLDKFHVHIRCFAAR